MLLCFLHFPQLRISPNKAGAGQRWEEVGSPPALRGSPSRKGPAEPTVHSVSLR